MAGKPQPARQIGKAKLLDLVKRVQNCSSRCAEERAALGAKIEAAATSDNFNAKALRPLMPLLKMDPGPQAHLWRTMMLYADHLGIGAQGDLEDVNPATDDEDEGADQETDEAAETEQDGEGDQQDIEALTGDPTGADAVDQVLAGMDVPELGRFRTGMGNAVTVEAVNRGLERFTTDHPDHAEAALEIAQARLVEIDAEAGGGEDLRPDSLKNAEQAEAADTVHAATGKKPRSPRKPRAPKDGAAHNDGPGFGQAVH